MDPLKEQDMLIVQESEFATKNITPLFWKYALFTLLGLLLQTASVIADGIFVGNGVGPLGLATIGIIAPLWTINVAFFNLFGMGGATIAVVKRGEGNQEDARRIYGTIIIFSFLFSAFVSTIALLNLESVLTFLGGTPEIISSAKEYAIPYLLGAPICVAGSVATYFARADEKPFAAALAYALPAVVAIVLEYFLIMKMGMGMMGSSIPWVVCVGGSIFLIPYMQRKSHIFKLKLSDIKLDFSIVLKTVRVGLVTTLVQSLMRESPSF